MKKYSLLVLILLIVACKKKLFKEPERLIPQDKMTEILYDLTILSATKKTDKIYMENNKLEIMQFLYDKYKIDSVQFVENNDYYASQPLLYKTMYDSIASRIEAKGAYFEELRRRKNDSIKEARKKRENVVKRVKDSLNQIHQDNASQPKK